VTESGYEVERSGDEIAFLWRRERVGIGFDLLHEEKDGLHAEVQVKALTPAGWTPDAAHIHWARLNLSSTSSRSALLKHLKSRNGEIDWEAKLEIACERTRREYRRGAPLVDLSTVAPRPQLYLTDPARGPGIPLGETSVFYGDGASLKSLLSLAIGLSAATGLPIGPFHPTRRVGVMTLDWETTEEEQAERLNRLCYGAGLSVPAVFYRDYYRSLTEVVRAVRQDVAENDIGLVIVDSIAPACGGEVTAEQAIPFFNALRSLGPDVTRLVVSHVSHSTATKESGAGRPFGSVFVRNLARSAWEIQRAEEGGDDEHVLVGMYHRKVNRGRPQRDVGLRVCFRDPDGEIVIRRTELLENVDLAAHASVGDRMVYALQRGALDTNALAEAADTKPETAARLARRHPKIVALGTGGRFGRGAVTTWGLKTDAGQASG
jgi:hypothetical protein